MGPLAGINVLEIKGLGPAPYAGMLLADLGANVLVVERPADTASIALPAEKDLFSRGKQRLELDLKSTADLDVLLNLVDSSDVLIEGFRPGVAERLGFGPQECMTRNPALVYGRMTGWGQEGPLANKAGHDINYIGLTGALAAMGTQERPMVPLNLLGDFAGGSLFLVVGVLAALHERRESNQGQVVDAAIVDGTTHLMTLIHSLLSLDLWQPQRAANLLDGGAPFYRVYRTSDAQFMAVGALEPEFFTRVIQTLNLPESLSTLQHERSAWPELTQHLEKAFESKTREEWETLFESVDACVSPVLTVSEAAEHPHNVTRGVSAQIDGVSQSSAAPRFSRSHADISSSSPTLEPLSVDAALEMWGKTRR